MKTIKNIGNPRKNIQKNIFKRYVLIYIYIFARGGGCIEDGSDDDFPTPTSHKKDDDGYTYFWSYRKGFFDILVGMCFDISSFFHVLTTPLYIYSLARGGGCIGASVHRYWFKASTINFPTPT